MSKIKTRALALIAAAALLLAALAQVLFFMPRPAAAADEGTEGPTAVMADPTYQLISLGADDSMMLMSDGTVQGSLTPSVGFGGRANSNGLGEASRYTVANGVAVTLKNLSISAEACFTVAMQTHPTGTLTDGGGVHVVFRVMLEGANYTFALIVYRNDASMADGYFWNPVGVALEGDEWQAETVTLRFTDTSLAISYTGATTADFAETTISTENGFSGIFEDFTNSERPNYSDKAYLSFNCYNPNAGQETGHVDFTLASINGQTPQAGYKAAMDAQVTAFVDAVVAAGDGSDQDKVDAAVALNVFGEDQAYGKLLAQYGSEEQKADVAEARAKITELNGDAIYAELRGKVDAFVAAVEVYDQFDDATKTAAVEAYNAIDWSLYDDLNDNFRGQIDEAVADMKELTFFKNAMNDVYDAKLALLETATAAEFSSSAVYLSFRGSVEVWAGYTP